MEQLLTQGLFAELLLLSMVLVINFFTPLRYMADRYLGFRFYCQALANKVNKRGRPNSQQIIAGWLAVGVTLAPLLIILWLFADFVDIDWLWHGFLLWLALGWHQLRYASSQIVAALNGKQKQLAKERLAPWVLRETQPLSETGIIKACIESHCVRAQQQLFTVIFFYILFGPLFALGYRLILEMHYSWNTKLEEYQAFGRGAATLVNLLQWLPCRLMTLFMLLTMSGRHFILFWRLLSAEFFSAKSLVILHCHALSLGVRLSSPVIYQGKKVRRPVFNQRNRQPDIADIQRSIRQLEQVFLLPLLLLMLVAVISSASSLLQ
jgi:adenosylcobinamide-phosphate synthase